MIHKTDEKFPVRLDENLLFPDFDNHILLSEAWLSSTGGVSSETLAPLLLKFGPNTIEVCTTIIF